MDDIEQRLERLRQTVISKGGFKSVTVPRRMHRAHHQDACHRGCPRDTEPREQQIRATRREQDEIAFRYLDAHFGQWINGTEIENICGSRCVNNVAVRLRASLDKSLDVDSRCIDHRLQVWEYRLCAKEDSQRLQRRANKLKESLFSP